MRLHQQLIPMMTLIAILIHSTASADTFADKVASMRSRNDQQIYATKVGYPICSSVVDRKIDEDRAIASLLIEEERHDFLATAEQLGMTAMGERILNFATTYPPSLNFVASESYLQQPNLNDRVQHPITHPRYYVPPQHFVYCFTGNTPVVTISNVSDPDEDKVRWGMSQTTMLEVDPWDLILSSTHQLFDDPRFQKDCWDTVVAVQAGVVFPDEQFQIITYSCSDAAKPVELRVTPKHNFLTQPAHASSPEQTTYPWIRAESLEPQTQLFSKGYYPDTKQQCEVTKNETQTVIWKRSSSIVNYDEESLHDMLEIVSNGEDLMPFYVYNLTTHSTHQYYVGPYNGQVLVHNAK